MSSERKAKLHLKYSESGATLFTTAQTKRRFALCTTALTSNKKYSVRLKRIYRSQIDIERSICMDSESKQNMTDIYFDLSQRAWGGEYFQYNKTFATEGAFYPFVRTIFNSYRPVDEGCIWIGSIHEYPLIYVANTIANWKCPYSKGGFVRTEPFLPYYEAMKILPRLQNKKIFPDLDVQLTY